MTVRRSVSKALGSIALVLSCAGAAVHAQDPAKGGALLAAARQAIGGETRLAAVKTLQVTGTFRRVVGNNDTDGDFEVFLELPGTYLRSEKTGTPGQPSTETIEALMGAEVRDAVRGGGGRGGANAGGANAGGDGLPPAGNGDEPPAERRDEAPGDVPAAPADSAPGPAEGRGRGGLGAGQEAQLRARQAEVSRLLLMWLLRSDAPLAWIGIAESPDGKADVLGARYADGQPTRLFLEGSSHMPLMMQWEASPARAGGAGRRGRGGQPGGGAPAAEGARQGGPAPLATFDMTFSDHREVNGIRLPYVITRGTDGKTTERWTISRYRVNPSFNAETFTR